MVAKHARTLTRRRERRSVACAAGAGRAAAGRYGSAPTDRPLNMLSRNTATPVAFPPFPRGPYGVIYADPPWDYRGQTQHSGPDGSGDTGSAAAYYRTVPSRWLRALPVLSMAARNCLLFMWSSSPHLDQAISLGQVWGFEWATVGFVWNKGRANPGFYTMSRCELCLVFKRGAIPDPRGARNMDQYIEAARRDHSRKPDEARDRIAAMFPAQRKIELFARDAFDGWDAWGLEVLKETWADEASDQDAAGKGQLF